MWLLPICFSLGQLLRLGTVERPFGLARFRFHWLRFNKPALRLVVGARGRLIALAFIDLIGVVGHRCLLG
jgi:hypothetical protein